MSRAWGDRSAAEKAVLNPAAIALAIRAGAVGYQAERGSPMPLALAFLVVAAVIHRPMREQLPGTIATSFPTWVLRNPEIRSTFGNRVRAIVPAVREGLAIGANSGAFSLGGGDVVVGEMEPARPSGVLVELTAKAKFVGRWFGRVGDAQTVMALLGVTP